MPLDPNRSLVAPAFDLNEEQIQLLYAIMDTFIAQLNDEEKRVLKERLCGANGTHTPEQVEAFADLTASSLQTWDVVKAFLNRAVAPEKRKELNLILTVLSTRAGMLALTGHFANFQDLSRQEREKIMQSWMNSSIPPLRLLYKTFASVSCHPVYAMLDSPLHKGMLYPSRDELRTHPEYKAPNTRERLPMLSLNDLTPSLKFDVIIVGSGAGGGKHYIFAHFENKKS